jgi:histidinol-phosphate aminotransferase
MALEFAARLRNIPIYPIAGGYSLPEDVSLLASNESPEPPLPEVVAAAEAALRGVNRYPDPGYGALRGALSHRYGVPTERIALGNGSCDVLFATALALLEPGAEVVYAWPSFSVYPQLAALTGATAVTVDLDADDRHDLDAMLDAITVATRLVLVCNPNNPTSTAVPAADIAAFVAKVPPHVCVIVDEAYAEFNALDDPDTTLDLLKRHPNLALLRTFSKVYGLCGLRVGFALCGSPDLRAAVEQVRQPFYVNAAAQAAAVEALKHGDEVARRVDRAVAGRARLVDAVQDLGLIVRESHANFIWHSLPEDAVEADIVEGLKERRVLVRAGRALGREGWLRVTVGTPRDNDRYAAALRELVA